ncbi:hypothetical protein KY290_015081 [Solanum tuberosum]|uniref:Uncharacterized protein n=1 Tax=Solanum tuberosum TaxID=4113 RepID=A0ABQ7VRJ1_SOLTU|nr:hypothetical protein KY285_014467 [Solanum tuberosum]KAH0771100.1 hypothetical protein KY290_015081 [Solanum tuberosum]
MVSCHDSQFCMHQHSLHVVKFNREEMADLPRKPGGGSMMIRCEGCPSDPKGNIVALAYFTSNANGKTILHMHGHC